MNGEFKELFDRIVNFSNEVHGQRHQENLKKFSDIFERLNNLPCGERSGRYESFSNQIKAIWIILCILLTAITSQLLK